MSSTKTPTKAGKWMEWSCRVIAAVILIQTLRFKFTAAPESVFIFESVGMEPWGRIGSGVTELIAGVLLLIPAKRFASVGALTALGVISGALFFHLTVLGIDVQGDGGALFGAALAVFVLSAIVLARTWTGLLEWLDPIGLRRGTNSRRLD